jgi:hypothetical protein
MSYENGLSMEERVSSLFQPDTLLPDQYLDTYRRKLPLEPEKKLMLAVLEDAIACFQKYVSARDGKGKVLFQDAEDWIKEENGDGLFSFAHVCETLGFDPAYLRQGLKVWKQQHAARPIQAKVTGLRRDGESSGAFPSRADGTTPAQSWAPRPSVKHIQGGGWHGQLPPFCSNALARLKAVERDS